MTVVQEEETPQLPERLRKRLEDRKNAEAQGQGQGLMVAGKFMERFKANLASKQAMQKRAASAIPLRRESIGEMMEAIEGLGAKPGSPRSRKKITINFDKRQRVAGGVA